MSPSSAFVFAKFDTISVQNDKLFFIEATNCFFKNLFAYPKQVVDIFRRTFVGNGNRTPAILYSV